MRLTDKMKDDERHIIQRILRGETALYEHFLNTYGQQVFILVARIVSNQEDAEELTQDVFLKAFQHLSSFKGTSSFSTWIYSIAYNTAISNYNRENETYNFLKRNVQFSLFFTPSKQRHSITI